MRISDWSSDVCSSDLKFSEPARQAIDGLAPTNVACPDRLAREKPTIEPDTKVRPLLERGVPRSLHCPAKRKRCSMCIEQSQIIPLGSDKDVIKVAVTEQRPQASLECAIGRESLQCFGATEGQRRIGPIERVKSGSGNDADGRLPAARAGTQHRKNHGRFVRRRDPP